MGNVESRERFDLALYERNMGRSEQFIPTNRNNVVVGYYFPDADATVFMSTALGEVLVWRLGSERTF